MTKRKYISEFGLNMFGSEFYLLQQQDLDMFEESGIKCHIYMIAQRNRIMLEPQSVKFDKNYVTGSFNIQIKNELEKINFKTYNYLSAINPRLECNYPYTEFKIYNDENIVVSSGKVANLLPAFKIYHSCLDFEVLYVGQAYGVEGNRTASKRLKEHSTLQKIYSEAIRRSPDKDIWIILWRFEEVFMASFDGRKNEYLASNQEDEEHIKNVLNKPISEQQKINFTEAALIKYFAPSYNEIFKNTFPNPLHSSYSKCYEIDLNSICVELQTEELFFRLWSKKVDPEWIHFCMFELNSADERKSMFDF